MNEIISLIEAGDLAAARELYALGLSKKAYSGHEQQIIEQTLEHSEKRIVVPDVPDAVVEKKPARARKGNTK